jgi:hypothetical protein
MKVTIRGAWAPVMKAGAWLLCVALGLTSGCDWYGNLWASASFKPSGAGGDVCAGLGGAGGFGGGGGAGGDGVGGDGSGVGGSSGVGAGVGGGSGESAVAGVTVGAGVGGGDSAWSNGDEGRARAPHQPRHRIGGRQADCPGTTPPTPAWSPPPLPPVANLIPLTTTRLRAIAAAQGVGAGLTGIQLNRAYGLVFENWVLTMLGQKPRNTMSFLSPERQTKNASNGGLPASVIPEYVSDLALFFWGGLSPSVLPDSELWEVKAVTGTLTLASSRWQILGLIDVASRSPAGMSTKGKHPPPTVVFTITGNTLLSDNVLTEATLSDVAIWVQVVFEDATTPDDPDPDLYIGQLEPANPEVYGSGVPIPSPASGAHSKLLSPTTPPMQVPGDPDPPEVD